MVKGLGRDTNPTATVKMLPSFVRSLPDGSGESPCSAQHCCFSKVSCCQYSQQRPRAASGSGLLPASLRKHLCILSLGECWQSGFFFSLRRVDFDLMLLVCGKDLVSAQEQPLPSVLSAGLAVGAVAGHGKGSLYSSEPAVHSALFRATWRAGCCSETPQIAK